MSWRWNRDQQAFEKTEVLDVVSFEGMAAKLNEAEQYIGELEDIAATRAKEAAEAHKLRQRFQHIYDAVKVSSPGNPNTLNAVRDYIRDTIFGERHGTDTVDVAARWGVHIGPPKWEDQ